MRYSDLKSFREKLSGFILFILITILILVVYLNSPSWLDKMEWRLEDYMYKFRGTNPPGDQIVIVAIDDKSQQKFGKWPWDRKQIAQLVESISPAQPKVLYLDLFLSPDLYEDTCGNTKILAEAIERNKNVILPIYFNLSELGIAETEAPPSVSKSAWFRSEQPNLYPSLVAKEIHYPSELLLRTKALYGQINTTYDIDGKVRKDPLLVYYDQNFYPSAALQIVRSYLNVKPEQIKWGRNKLSLKELGIPCDKRGEMLITFCGPQKTFTYYSAGEVLDQKIELKKLSHRIVMVGLVSSKSFLATPPSLLPSVEKTANAVENIIHQNFLYRANFLYDLLFIISIGFFCAIVLPQVSLTYRMVILLLFLFVSTNLSFLLFTTSSILTKPFYPLLEISFFTIVAPAMKPKKKVVRKSARSIQTETALPLVGEKEKTFTAMEKTEEEIGFSPAKEEERTQAILESQVILSSSAEEKKTREKKTTTQINLIQFGRYQILKPIGKGAMGMVYKGKDPAIDRLVALKTIRLEELFSDQKIEELRKRLIFEAQAAGKLSHPNIVTIYDVGVEGNLEYVAMEYLQGYTLDKLIEKKSEVNYRIVAKIMIQICDALSYAHQRGIVHRDIKPNNIMILDDFVVKVMDFGIARLGVSNLTQEGVALGTPSYISPEQLQGKPADKRSDIFSLGVVLYELLTKKKPFPGETINSLIYNIINEEPLPPSVINDKTPLIFDRITSKAMAKNLEERFQDASEMGAMLKEFVSSFVVTRSFRI
jgi:CHASE2 domain-containing sensor protein/tRNA A-37 threonylcarbamoyl transferase component Bud32